jgi:prolyl-tRNA editing enzyme YbaK/EbsC (Cys-tRNA(Pro) deacylase)
MDTVKIVIELPRAVLSGEYHSRITDILDSYGITYRILAHGEPVFTVEAAARQRGVVLEEMVKSILLVDRAGRFAMACVRGADRVDPKAVQAGLGEGWRRLAFASADQIRAVTGCVQGAVSPIGLPETVPVVFDAAIAMSQKVNISGGDPTFGLELPAADLIRVVQPRFANIAAAA